MNTSELIPGEGAAAAGGVFGVTAAAFFCRGFRVFGQLRIYFGSLDRMNAAIVGVRFG